MSRLSAVDKSRLAEWRAMAAAKALACVADHAKADREYARFYDTRARVGGGGAIDLAIHLTGYSFNDAVQLLRSKGL